jgi:hypothetical protein
MKRTSAANMVVLFPFLPGVGRSNRFSGKIAIRLHLKRSFAALQLGEKRIP